jgi:hypothetical protein
MLGVNESNSVAQLIIYISNNVTGSVFLTFLLIFLLFLAFFFAFRVPPFFAVLLLLPLVIVFMSFESNFLIIGGLILILLGFTFAVNYILWG